MPPAKGGVFHAEFASADASAPANEAAARMRLYQQGSTAAVTLSATDQVQIEELILEAELGVTPAGAGGVDVFDGADENVGAGELIARVQFPQMSSQVVPLSTPHLCQKGTYPKVRSTAAGPVSVEAKGTILGG